MLVCDDVINSLFSLFWLIVVHTRAVKGIYDDVVHHLPKEGEHQDLRRKERKLQDPKEEAERALVEEKYRKQRGFALEDSEAHRQYFYLKYGFTPPQAAPIPDVIPLPQQRNREREKDRDMSAEEHAQALVEFLLFVK